MRLMMRFKRVTHGIAALAMFSASYAASAADPLTTNTPSFRIPFAVEASNSENAGTAILFTGKDGGNLEVRQRVDAKAGGFEFTAPSDGKYAFAVRMTNASGEVVGGPGPVEPELVVVVDQTPPTLNFQLAEASPGDVTVSWTCSEPQVAPESLRLEYAEGSDGRWMRVETKSDAAGQATIRSQPGNSVSIRGMITDLAGNRGNGSGQIVLASRSHQSLSNLQGGPSSLMVPAEQPNYTLGSTPFARTRQQPQSYQPPATDPYYAAVAPPQQNQAPTGQNQFQQPIAGPQPTQTQPPGPAMSPQQQHQVNYGRYSSASYTPEVRSARTAAGTNGSAISASGQIVNNRVFDINYEVQDVGPSGVSTVKLFVTENNGQNWFSYGDDVDLRSPFQVDTRGEGTFGFAVRVRNGLGFADPPPQPGDLPSIVVTVDQTPPVANFRQPEIVAEGRGWIQLKWHTTDSHPSAAPVRLEYAISASGPWTPVFDWQPDQGGYEMELQPGMPNTVYYRLLARDAAGNVTTVQTPHPLMIDQHRPTVRLLSIQPVSDIQGY